MAKEKRKPQNRISTKVRKKLYIEALEKTFGILAPACKLSGIPRRTVHHWRTTDPEFEEDCQNIKIDAKDWGEYKLFELMKSNNPAGIIFYNKTQNRDRGYAEIQPNQEDRNVTLNIEYYQLSEEEKNEIVPEVKQLKKGA